MADNKDYIPSSDARFAVFQTTFCTYALAHAAQLQIPVGTGELLQQDQQAYEAADAAHQVEIQTAKAKTATKRAKKKALISTIRQIVRQLQSNPSITDEQRLALGIPIRKQGKTPAPVPASAPLAKVEKIQEFSHTLRLIDTETNRSAKPDGVDGSELWVKILPPGQPAPADPAEMDYAGTHTTTKVTHTFDASHAGQTAYYRLRWLNAKGEPGAWGPQVAATIAA